MSKLFFPLRLVLFSYLLFANLIFIFVELEHKYYHTAYIVIVQEQLSKFRYISLQGGKGYFSYQIHAGNRWENDYLILRVHLMSI